MERDWRSTARPAQLPPEGEWRIWLQLAGRGFGKTRSGAEWVRGLAESGAAKRIALCGPTMHDTRSVMVEGESGLLSISTDWCRPVFEPTRRLLKWPSGAQAFLYSADEVDRLRGHQHDALWCDELATWRYPSAFDMLTLGLRLGKDPRTVITTTPKPTRLIRELLKRAEVDPHDVRLSRGKTVENAEHLARPALQQFLRQYSGTRLGRQELDAELLEDTPGSLWSRDQIESLRVSKAPPLRRVIVAVDPAVSTGENADETGIIVAGLGEDGRAYIVEDLSGKYTPSVWAHRVADAYALHQADRVIGEKNQGGLMVEEVLRAADASLPVKLVSATRGKVVRAEPIAALYEQRRVMHCGAFPQLEDQMCGFTSDFDSKSAGYSPDRVDALVWALSELLIGESFQNWADHFSAMAEAKGALPQPTEPPQSVAHALVVVSKPAPKPIKAVLHAKPHSNFYVRKSRYSAGEDGVIRDVELAHVQLLLDAGCWCARGAD